ncbi:hypothetical protein AGMMS49957_09910 [Synergistales bacterium]|nr:hypothetical protein AGMMS49957_09910 [Synergistales bacterium]
MKLLKWLDRYFEEMVLVSLLVTISFVMLAQIIARYIFNDSMSWPEEFSRYCYIYTVFFSISYTVKKGNMLRVGVVMDLFPTFIQNTVRILCDLAMLSLFAYFFYRSFLVVGRIKNVTHELSSAMRIPMWCVYMSVLIGFGLAALRTVQAIIDHIRHFNDRNESTTQATIKEAQAEAELASQDDLAYREGGVKGGAA